MSGGGAIHIFRPKIRLMLETDRKIPVEGDEQRYARSVESWEKKTLADAEALTTAVEKVALKPHSGIELVAGDFEREYPNPKISSEGEISSSSTSTGPHFLLELHPARGRKVHGGNVTVAFVLKTKPKTEALLKFSNEIENVVRIAGGLDQIKLFEPYGVYRVEFESGMVKSAYVLSKVPLSQLKQAVEATPWGLMGYETFRASKILIIDLDENGAMKKNDAGFYLANPTAALIDEPYEMITLQINGTMRPKAKIRRASREEVLKAIARPVPESEKDREFLKSIEAQFSG